MIYVKRAAMRAMSANQAQTQAQASTQVAQPQADNNQPAQSTEIKDVTMSEANTESAQGEGKGVTPITIPLLIPHSEWRHSNPTPIGNCCCVGPPPRRLGSYRGSEPDSEDSIPTPYPLHGNSGRPNQLAFQSFWRGGYLSFDLYAHAGCYPGKITLLLGWADVKLSLRTTF